jgi:hypothetical protein
MASQKKALNDKIPFASISSLASRPVGSFKSSQLPEAGPSTEALLIFDGDGFGVPASTAFRIPFDARIYPISTSSGSRQKMLNVLVLKRLSGYIGIMPLYECELWAFGRWNFTGIEVASDLSADRKMRCPECHGRVQVHKQGKNGEAAHFEHDQRSLGCTMGDSFNGTRRRHPNPLK